MPNMNHGNQDELKREACNTAYDLINALRMIDDGAFVDDVVCAVSEGDAMTLFDMCYSENKRLHEKRLSE